MRANKGATSLSETIIQRTGHENVPVLLDVVKEGADRALSPRADSVLKNLSQAISKLEHEIELVDGKAADLMKKYAVTQEMTDEAAFILETSDSRDFLLEPTVPNIDR
ncbi:MAG: hypothetical protein QMC36_00905 [Patescibacteria group bacterium]